MDCPNQAAEQQARDQIDNKLFQAGWVIQEKKRLNLYESLGVAVREMDTDTAPTDYMLFIDGKDFRQCQIDAVSVLEEAFSKNKPRALLQMATGAGKTFTAVIICYRLAKYANQQSGKELDDGADELSCYEIDNSRLTKEPRVVSYNPAIPIESFDFIIIDECHRSIYKLWRHVLEYCYAFLLGLTATPTKKTLGYFNQNLVAEYTYENAVIDKVNVVYDIYRIKTQKSASGDSIEAGTAEQVRDRLTKKQRLQVLDADKEYSKTDLDRSIIAPNQIRTIAPVELWKAYQQLEKARVKGQPLNLLTNISSLIRFATGLADILEPFPELDDRRFNIRNKEGRAGKYLGLENDRKIYRLRQSFSNRKS